MKKDFSELVEFLDKKFNKIDKKFDKVNKDIEEFKNSTLTSFDEVLKDLEVLKEDKDIRNHQDEQKRKFYRIVVNHMETGKTTAEQLEEISKLNVL